MKAVSYILSMTDYKTDRHDIADILLKVANKPNPL